MNRSRDYRIAQRDRHVRSETKTAIKRRHTLDEVRDREARRAVREVLTTQPWWVM